MPLELLYLDGCPNWRVARERLGEALRRTGRRQATVTLVRVDSEEEARALRFPGSPTIRADGEDLFPGASGVGLACRVYRTPDGLAGSPTVDQLVDALGALDAAPAS